MKTTSYEISKKLKEAGFEADADYYWIESKVINKGIICVKNYRFDDYESGSEKLCKSFDLETLLDALPSVIERKGWGNDIYFKMNKNGFWYENSCSCDSSEYCPLETYYHIDRQKNESLADTAGRLLLLLHEKNLIKF